MVHVFEIYNKRGVLIDVISREPVPVAARSKA